MAVWTRVILLIWIAWAAVWAAAWFWSDRTVARPPRRREAPYRIVNILGFVALFGDGARVTLLGGRTWLPPLWQVPPALGWTLVGLALASAGLAVAARHTLGRLWSAAVTRKEGHRIVAEGPYALTRHPIYTALIGGALALAIAKGSPVALAGAALIIVGYVLKARVEERFLAAELGAEAYAAYARRVPMLVPFLR